MGQRKMPHTQVHAGKRVAVTLRNGQIIEGRFHQRSKNNRWIEVTLVKEDMAKEAGQRLVMVVRIPKEEIVAMSVLKGPLNLKKLGRKA